MNTKEYLKDKSYLITTTLVVVFMLSSFLIILRVQSEIIIIVDSCIIFLSSLVLVKEWMRRKAYYDELVQNVASLDQKYLVTEIMGEGSFYDANVFYETMKEINKSMSDIVSDVKTRQTDYKDYIELWIHEVKTPLAAAKLIASNDGGPGMRTILEELSHVENYLEQVLFYARSSSVEKDYLIQELNLDQSVKNVVKDLAPIFIQKRISLEVSCEGAVVYSDSKWVEFVIKQIIGNSLKYVKPEEGKVNVFIVDHEQALELIIEDNGPGIREHDIKRVFERGFTGQTGRHHQQATGMGLYLVKQLCFKLHLDVSIVSELNQGTSVSLFFPKSTMMFKE